MENFIGPLRKYAVWKGRARRSEYWYFMLFILVMTIVLTFVDFMTGTFSLDPESGEIGLLSTLFSLFVFLPQLAVSIRRLHDTGRSGWWCWIVLLPVIGVITLLVFDCLDSQPGSNEYGANPKDLMMAN
tara:strand:+ start:1224 stop:1610 length:387 start_codon:yes stop_codon:yes gene_type:complete